MNYIFLDVLHEVVTELGGRTFIPQDKNLFQFGMVFTNGNRMFFEGIVYKRCISERECGVLMKSIITLYEYVSISGYTYLLAEILEAEFQKTILLKPLTAKFYFQGEIEIAHMLGR